MAMSYSIYKTNTVFNIRVIMIMLFKTYECYM